MDLYTTTLNQKGLYTIADLDKTLYTDIALLVNDLLEGIVVAFDKISGAALDSAGRAIVNIGNNVYKTMSQGIVTGYYIVQHGQVIATDAQGKPVTSSNGQMDNNNNNSVNRFKTLEECLAQNPVYRGILASKPLADHIVLVKKNYICKGVDLFKYRWNTRANTTFGLTGQEYGLMHDQIKQHFPLIIQPIVTNGRLSPFEQCVIDPVHCVGKDNMDVQKIAFILNNKALIHREKEPSGKQHKHSKSNDHLHNKHNRFAGSSSKSNRRSNDMHTINDKYFIL